MVIPNQLLYFMALILYFFIFIFLILKRRFNVFQHISFLVLFVNTVFLIDRWMFELYLDGSGRQDIRLTFIPFYEIFKSVKLYLYSDYSYNLHGVLSFVFFSGMVSIMMGFTFPVISKVKNYKATLLKSFLIIIPIEIMGIFFMYSGLTYMKRFDTSIIIWQFIGISLGYFIYKKLALNICNEKE